QRVEEAEHDRHRDDRDRAGDQVLTQSLGHQNNLPVRPLAIGPSRIAGKKVSAPTRITIPTRRKTKVGLSVRIVPRPAGDTFWPARAPAMARTKRIGAKRAGTLTTPPRRQAQLHASARVG